MNIADNILNKNIKNINTEDVDVKPCGQGVLLHFYNDNPYRYVETTSNGIILGIESTKKYKSNETGEIEDSEEYIAVAKVIEVGPACRYVKKGDDVCAVKHMAVPIPFRKKEYYILDENNITCRFVKHNDE